MGVESLYNPIMENHMEKKMESEMVSTKFRLYIVGVYREYNPYILYSCIPTNPQKVVGYAVLPASSTSRVLANTAMARIAETRTEGSSLGVAVEELERRLL